MTTRSARCQSHADVTCFGYLIEGRVSTGAENRFDGEGRTGHIIQVFTYQTGPKSPLAPYSRSISIRRHTQD